MDRSDKKNEQGSQQRLDWLPIEELSSWDEEKETCKLLNGSHEDEVNEALVAIDAVKTSESVA